MARQIRRGPQADLITCGPLANGELGLVTDTGQVVIGGPTGTYPITHVVTPKMYGAAEDGATDDTAAILAAIAATPAGGELQFSPGKDYLFSGKLSFPTRIKVTSNGNIESTSTVARLIKKSTYNGTGMEITAPSLVMSGIKVDGQNGNGGDGIVVLASGVRLDDVAAHRQGGNGIRIGADSGGYQANAFVLTRIATIGNGGHGVKVSSATTDANAGVILGLQSDLNGGDGLYLGKCVANVLVGILTEANTGWGVTCSADSVGNTFVGGDMWEGNGTGQVQDLGQSNTFLGVAGIPSGTGVGRTVLPWGYAAWPTLVKLLINNENIANDPGLALKIVGYAADTSYSADGVGLLLLHNAAGNRQFWLGDLISGAGVKFTGTPGLGGHNKISGLVTKLYLQEALGHLIIGYPQDRTALVTIHNYSGVGSDTVLDVHGASDQSGHLIDAENHGDSNGAKFSVDDAGNVVCAGVYQSGSSAGVTADVAVAKVGGGTRTLHFVGGLYTGYTDS